jgi:hypothetical protein
LTQRLFLYRIIRNIPKTTVSKKTNAHKILNKIKGLPLGKKLWLEDKKEPIKKTPHQKTAGNIKGITTLTIDSMNR